MVRSDGFVRGCYFVQGIETRLRCSEWHAP
jgi:hypothetical protein